MRPILTEVSPHERFDEALEGVDARSSSPATRTCSSGAAAGSTRAPSGCRTRTTSRPSGRSSTDDVEFRRTPFDVERAADEILASGWPEAESFVAENIRRLRRVRKRPPSSSRAPERPGRAGREAARHQGRVLRRARERRSGALRGRSDAARRRRARRSRRVEARRRTAGDPARPRGRARRRDRGRASEAPDARRGRVLRLPARRPRGAGGGRRDARARRRDHDRTRRTTSSSSTRVSRCRSSTRACGRSISTRVESLCSQASRPIANLSRPAHRCLHAHPACVRLAHRAAPARGRARHGARAPPAQLPRHDAAQAPARSTTSPTAAARGWSCGSTSSPPRSTPPTAGLPGHRVVALTPQGRQLDQAAGRGARRRGGS